MELKIKNLTEEEIIMILEKRLKNKATTKQKSFWKKYIFNKYVWFDTKQSLVRESVRTLFLLFVIDRLKDIL